MTRSEFIIRLTSRYPQLSQKDTELAVAEILDAIQMTLVQGGRVEIRGFGTFTVNYRAPRIGRNPKKGEAVSVPEKCMPHFKAGKPLRELVDRLPFIWFQKAADQGFALFGPLVTDDLPNSNFLRFAQHATTARIRMANNTYWFMFGEFLVFTITITR